MATRRLRFPDERIVKKPIVQVLLAVLNDRIVLAKRSLAIMLRRALLYSPFLLVIAALARPVDAG